MGRTDRIGTPLQWRAFALALLVLVLDGLDIQILALVAPSLVREWGVTRAALGPAMSAALVGMACGAPLGGALGDRCGRRAALLAGVAAFGVFTLATAAVHTLVQLTTLRFLVGLGLGGCLPNATALIAEFFPGKFRALAVAGGIVGVLLGGIAGALTAAWLLPDAGWRALLVAGGAVPLSLLLVLVPALPESPRFLESRTASPVQSMAGASPARDRFAEIVSGPYRHNTTALWPAFFASLFVVYCFFNWIPVMLVDAGLSPAAGTRGSLLFNVGGVAGALTAALIVLRFGLKSTVIGAAAVALAVSIALAAAPWHAADPGRPDAAEAIALWGLFFAGAAVNAVQIGLYAIAAATYASACRATGIGWALGFGRAGAIVAVMLVVVIASLANYQSRAVAQG